MRKIIELGKIDYNRSGRKNCLATLEISWDGARFTASGNIWNPRGTYTYSGGQIVEEVCGYFPQNKQAQRILAIWRDWHLNDMKAGSPDQEAFLKANPIADRLNHYKAACDALAAAGINPDPNYTHNGKPYAYGSAWLKRDIPSDVVAEIESWFA
jgi:hypothetical protein